MKHIVWLGSTRDDVSAFPADARQDAGHQLWRVQNGLEPDNWKPMATVGPGVREIRISDDGRAFRVMYVANIGDKVFVLHGFEKKTQKTGQRDIELAQEVQGDRRFPMSKARSVFHDLFDAEEAVDLEIRSVLLVGLQEWLKREGGIQAEAAKKLGVTQARISEIRNGKTSRFTVDKLIALAVRAGLHPHMELAA